MPSDADACQEISAADLRRTTAALEQATAIAKKNGATSWLTRHQSVTIALVGVVVGLVSWGVNRWTRERVLETQAPIDAKQDARTGTLETKVADEIDARKHDSARLRQNDEDLVEYLQESDRYDRAVLDSVADKLRVRKPDRAPLDRAAKRVRAIKDRGRAE